MKKMVETEENFDLDCNLKTGPLQGRVFKVLKTVLSTFLD